jgi:hypothetical protein
MRGSSGDETPGHIQPELFVTDLRGGFHAGEDEVVVDDHCVRAIPRRTALRSWCWRSEDVGGD